MTNISANAVKSAEVSAAVAMEMQRAHAAQSHSNMAQATAPQKNPTPQVKAVDPVYMQQQLNDVVELLNSHMEKLGRNLGFGVDHKADHTVIVVKDKSTGEIVRQIPSDAVLKVAHSIEDLKGLIYSKKA